MIEALQLMDLESWFSEYGETKKLANDELQIKDCPSCGDDRFKLYINLDKFCWICHHCKYGQGIGDICHLMADVSSRHINDIRLELASYVVPATSSNKFAEYMKSQLLHTVQEEDFDIGPEGVELPGTRDFTTTLSSLVLKYAISRGLTEFDVEANQLRVANKLRNIIGPFLVFPVYYRGIPVAFQGRRISAKEPRYVSSDGIANWLWPMQTDGDTVYLVEGVFDALGCIKAGKNALCTFGNKITNNQINLLKKLNVKKVILAWDPTAYREIDLYLHKLRTCFSTFVVDFSEFLNKSGKKIDPGEALVDEDIMHKLSGYLDSAIIDTYSSSYINWYMNCKMRHS